MSETHAAEGSLTLEDTVFVRSGERPSIVTMLRLVSMVLAGLALAAYAGWATAKLLGNLAAFLQLERLAFGSLISAIAPAAAAAVPALTVAAAVGYILLSITAAIVVHYVLPHWHKKIQRQQRWIRVQVWGRSWWENVFIVFAWIFQIIEVVVFTLVWVTCAVVIFINLMVVFNP